MKSCPWNWGCRIPFPVQAIKEQKRLPSWRFASRLILASTSSHLDLSVLNLYFWHVVFCEVKCWRGALWRFMRASVERSAGWSEPHVTYRCVTIHEFRWGYPWTFYVSKILSRVPRGYITIACMSQNVKIVTKMNLRRKLTYKTYKENVPTTKTILAHFWAVETCKDKKCFVLTVRGNKIGQASKDFATSSA